eukprot:s568_g28.t1
MVEYRNFHSLQSFSNRFPILSIFSYRIHSIAETSNNHRAAMLAPTQIQGFPCWTSAPLAAVSGRPTQPFRERFRHEWVASGTLFAMTLRGRRRSSYRRRSWCITWPCAGGQDDLVPASQVPESHLDLMAEMKTWWEALVSSLAPGQQVSFSKKEVSMLKQRMVLLHNASEVAQKRAAQAEEQLQKTGADLAVVQQDADNSSVLSRYLEKLLKPNGFPCYEAFTGWLSPIGAGLWHSTAICASRTMEYSIKTLDDMCIRLNDLNQELLRRRSPSDVLNAMVSEAVDMVQQIGGSLAWAYGQSAKGSRWMGEQFAQPFVDRRVTERFRELLSTGNAQLQAQVLQTIHILLQSTPKDSTLFCNLTAGWYLNQVVTAEYDFRSNEDLLHLWMTVVKDIALMMDTGLVARAGKWLKVPHPGELPKDLRLRDPGARAAFAVATFRGADFVESCLACGLWTASWCEGCYLRDSRDPQRKLEYSPLCTDCDQCKRVCPLCERDGITWAAGNEVAQAELGHCDDGSIEVTGFVTSAGRLVEPEATVRITPLADGSSAPGSRRRQTMPSDGPPRGSGSADMP